METLFKLPSFVSVCQALKKDLFLHLLFIWRYCASAHVWRPDNSFGWWSLSFYHVGPWERIPVVRLGSELLLSHLSRPLPSFALKVIEF